MVYEWKKGRVFSVNPNIAGQICKDLESKGNLNAKSLVEVSTPIEAPLHKCFTWDNEKAANLYREQEARVLISSLVVVEEKQDGSAEESVPIKLFHNFSDDGNYEDIRNILLSPEKTDSLLEMALRDLRIFRSKYYQIKKLAKLNNLIDETISELE